MKIRFFILAFACAIATVSLTIVDHNGKPERAKKAELSFFDQLAEQARSSGELPHITLTFDQSKLAAHKYSAEHFGSTLTLSDKDWEVKLFLRGRYRRRVCDFPPLRIKFKKAHLRTAGLKEYNRFKLVTHCSDDFDYRDNLMREQLAYELYRLIAGQGFRTQLVELTYRDADSGESFQRLGILIEDGKEMAAAAHSKKCNKCSYLPSNAFVQGNPETLALFNYMIGNADWSAKTPRNVEIIRHQADQQHELVPFDFDFAALVDVEYAVPNPNYNQVSIRDRIWIWEFKDEPLQLAEVVAHYRSKEAAVMSHVENFPGLHKRSKRRIGKYLKSFFEELSESSFVEELAVQSTPAGG
ncbi:MAG: hypothetical protein D6772_13495 [Bacteroidetes bacterium]|nr:MAG: hypothetical protein D6772_13495 [Bacteroidota bacterium]